MPKYYCDYCATFLTHDSKSVRNSHISGWKHKASVKNWYEQFMANESQDIINQKIKLFEARVQGLTGDRPFPGAFPNMNMPPPPLHVPPNMNVPPPGYGGPR